MGHIVRPLELATLVLIVNTWGTQPRLVRGELEAALPSGREVITDPALQGLSKDQLVALADTLYPVFDGHDDERATLVNDLLARSGVRPHLAQDRGLQGVWSVPDPRVGALAATAVGLWIHLGDGAGDRLGTCADRACGDAWVDTSPGGHRRFCSITCQNRARAAAYRRRHRTTNP